MLEKEHSILDAVFEDMPEVPAYFKSQEFKDAFKGMEARNAERKRMHLQKRPRRSRTEKFDPRKFKRRNFNDLAKKEWGPGPWQDEPDRVDFRDPDTGFHCLLSRGPSGAWCGYVAVPYNHPLYRKFWDDPETEGLGAHGGLTYSSHCQADGPICHIAPRHERDDVWWFGFDCAHAGDLSPAMDALMTRYVSPMPHTIPRWMQDVYRDIQYVTNEVKDLAKQLAAYPLVKLMRPVPTRHKHTRKLHV